MPPFSDLFYVGVGGFLGANARYILSVWVGIHLETALNYEFPYGTLFVNWSGSFLLAIFGVWFTKQTTLSANVRLLIGTGFFGAYTTYSTYVNESIDLIRAGNWQQGVSDILLTNTLCLLGVLAGIWVAHRF